MRCETAYSITSSARTRNVSGMVSPIALAVLRLTTSSLPVLQAILQSSGRLDRKGDFGPQRDYSLETIKVSDEFAQSTIFPDGSCDRRLPNSGVDGQ
jgi:hypothetical protein